MKCFYYLKHFKRLVIIISSLSIIAGYSLHTYTTEQNHSIFTTSALAASALDTTIPLGKGNSPGYSLLEDVKSFESWVVVKNQIANIRTEPTIQSPILLKAQPKSCFPVLDQVGTWYKIQLGKGQIGWISESLVDSKDKRNAREVTRNKMDTKNRDPKVSRGIRDSEASNDPQVANDTVDTKDTKRLYQFVQVKSGTHVFTGPDQSLETNQIMDSKINYIPLAVSGDWVQLVANDTGDVVWVPLQTITWGYGEGPVTNVIKVQSGQLLKGRSIVLDAGHGGKDEGAAGKQRPIKERDINLAVTNLLEKKLKAAGAEVILTRKTNEEYISLADRVRIADDTKADLFISIHQNMFPKDPSVRGVNTYYYNTSLSQGLAKMIQSQAMLSLYHDRNSERLPSQDDFFVLNQNNRPSVLIEGCFLSNPTELAQSIEPDFQEKLASGIFLGILQYYEMRENNIVVG